MASVLKGKDKPFVDEAPKTDYGIGMGLVEKEATYLVTRDCIIVFNKPATPCKRHPRHIYIDGAQSRCTFLRQEENYLSF